MILKGDPLEEVDCFKYLGSQVAADGGCERDVIEGVRVGLRIELNSGLIEDGMRFTLELLL